jgi:hypothetical protein
MHASADTLGYKDRSLVLKIIGALLLIAGAAIGYLGPVEMSTFYLFTEGGRFHYAGFGFGSFMFANIASQIIGYYLISIVFLLLGYGHLAIRRWARTLTVVILWFWLVIGAPMIVVVFFILAGTKELSLAAGISALIALALSYFVFPALLIRFYQGQNVRRTFEKKDDREYWIEALPTPILVLSCLFLFYILMLHILIMFNGIFPLFGVFRFGLQGIVLLDISIGCLMVMTWGTLRQRAWAWWISVLLLGSFTFSTVFTFFRYSYADLLAGLAFPARELEILGGIPAQGYHFSIMVGLPLLITLVIALLSKRYFKPGLRL